MSTHSILLWDRINKDIYLEVLGSELTKKSALISVQLWTTNALNQATSKALPIKTGKLQGQKIKLSPQGKDLME